MLFLVELLKTLGTNEAYRERVLEIMMVLPCLVYDVRPREGSET